MKDSCVAEISNGRHLCSTKTIREIAILHKDRIEDSYEAQKPMEDN